MKHKLIFYTFYRYSRLKIIGIKILITFASLVVAVGPGDDDTADIDSPWTSPYKLYDIIQFEVFTKVIFVKCVNRNKAPFPPRNAFKWLLDFETRLLSFLASYNLFTIGYC